VTVGVARTGHVSQTCGLSTYGLKAHLREMSTPPKLTFGHGTLLFYFIRRHGRTEPALFTTYSLWMHSFFSSDSRRNEWSHVYFQNYFYRQRI